MSELKSNATPETETVFVSYAHSSPEHKQAVEEDTDVKAAHGPDEGWITWMRTGIKKANWVLIFFDDVYRRRFEGDEQPSKGLGGTYEGAIIAAEHLRQDQTIDEKICSALAGSGRAPK